MNNRYAQSAEGPRAAETFVVDLTSVCLRSGTVRLPLSLIGRFSEGQHKVTAGGEEQIIEFEAPRTVSGLTPFFERAELRSNDRVQFEFRGQQLELTAVKRERPNPTQAAGSRVQVGHSAVQGAPQTVREGGVRITSRGLFPAPAELVEASTEMSNEGAGSSSASAQGSEAASSDGAELGYSGSVSTTKRVRIEGGLPPNADTVTPRPVDRASAHDVWARRQRPAWRSLDTMVAGPVVAPEEAAEAFSESTVRVVRRSQGTSTPLEVEAPPLRKAEADPVADEGRADSDSLEERPTMSYSMSWPLPETRRASPAARPADGPLSGRDGSPDEVKQPVPVAKSVPAPSSRAQLDPYLDAPIDADREAHYTPPTILESDLLSIPRAGTWRAESEEAYLEYQEARVAANAEPTAATTERRPGILGRLGFTRSSPQQGGEQERDFAAASQKVEPGPAPTQDGRSRADAVTEAWEAEDATAAEADDLESSYASDDNIEVSGSRTQAAEEETSAATAGRPSARVIVDDSVYDVDFDTDVEPQLTAGSGGVPSLESDMAQLQTYLRRPDVPAIVRCDDLAVRLKMSQERVSNAMLRLAEDRERFTPLRGDAYMVRRTR